MVPSFLCTAFLAVLLAASSVQAQTTTATSSVTSKITTAAGPWPTQSGIITSCTSYYKVTTGDTCSAIVSKYGTFTLDDFYKWNPAVQTDCSELLVGYYVCVGVPGTPTAPITTTTTPTTTAAPTPTQPGIISTCNNYYLVKQDDYCLKIVDSYGDTFTLQQFYSWNPAVGSDCSSLLAGYYVCVGVSS